MGGKAGQLPQTFSEHFRPSNLPELAWQGSIGSIPGRRHGRKCDENVWVTETGATPFPDRAASTHLIFVRKNHLIVFGGLGAVRGSSSTGGRQQLQALNDVQLLDISTRRWLPPPRKTTRIPTPAAAPPVTPIIPRPRYSHLSCVSGNRLFIIGGKDSAGAKLDDVCIYDLERREWVQREPYMQSLDADHAFIATSDFHVRALPEPHSPGCPEDMKPFSYSEPATDDEPCDIYLHNNHSPRNLDAFFRLPSGELRVETLTTGSEAPSLRFPTGAILGSTLVVAGNQVVNSNNNTEQQQNSNFGIWTLDLPSNQWLRVDTGELLTIGAWGAGYIWHDRNKFFTFGKRTVPAPDSRRVLADNILRWDAVAVVDLEALGIYQPPVLKLDPKRQEMGLAVLAAERAERGADFAFLCEDGRRIPCSRQLIMERWPWFRDRYYSAGLFGGASATKHGKRGTEITIMEGSAALTQSYPVTMALLQYLYSLALGTALQRAPAVLSYLLLISTEFQLAHLQALVRHAMHLALTDETAEGVYEIAASCACRSLQIRAFRTVAETRDKRKAQAASPIGRRPGRGRSNSEGTQLITPSSSRSTGGVNSSGFPPSAFARPLHSTKTLVASRLQAPVNVSSQQQQIIPRIIPPVPYSTLVTRTSDPLPRSVIPARAASLARKSSSQRDLTSRIQIPDMAASPKPPLIHVHPGNTAASSPAAAPAPLWLNRPAPAPASSSSAHQAQKSSSSAPSSQREVSNAVQTDAGPGTPTPPPQAQRKRSQSVGTRLPRPGARATMATPTASKPPPPVPAVPKTDLTPKRSQSVETRLPRPGTRATTPTSKSKPPPPVPAVAPRSPTPKRSQSVETQTRLPRPGLPRTTTTPTASITKLPPPPVPAVPRIHMSMPMSMSLPTRLRPLNRFTLAQNLEKATVEGPRQQQNRGRKSLLVQPGLSARRG
ncbi:hypothetical protein C8R46DRAFT_1262216 [Mycena filopes]|nr:hypothetical protein C8R46DRAFT_1262216 [Mycena filopes]